jgi:hypothetical protein
MLTIDRPLRWLCTEEAAFQRTMEGLERALVVSVPVVESVWAQCLKGALAEVEEALGGHIAAAAAEGGILASEDLNGSMLPSLMRREEKLRRSVVQLRDRARDLRQQAAAIAELDPRETTSHWDFGKRPPAARALQREAANLLFALRTLRDQEMDVLWEDLSRDVGIGD